MRMSWADRRVVLTAVTMGLAASVVVTPMVAISPHAAATPGCGSERAVRQHGAAARGSGVTVTGTALRAISCQQPPRTPEAASAAWMRQERQRFVKQCDAAVKYDDPAYVEQWCTPEAPGAAVVVTASDVQDLPIDPGTLTMQPDQGWVLLNIETIAYTRATAQQFHTTVVDTPVTVRVTPTAYTWDFAEGAPFTTTTPGAPYPEHSIWHTYQRHTRDGETRTITLTTTWTATYAVAGGPWLPVTGTATTTLTTPAFTVRQARTHLTDGTEIHQP